MHFRCLLTLFVSGFNRKNTLFFPFFDVIFVAYVCPYITAYRVFRRIQRNPNQPRAKHFLVFKYVLIVIEPDKHFLRNVFRQSRVAHDRSRCAKDSSMVQHKCLIESYFIFLRRRRRLFGHSVHKNFRAFVHFSIKSAF
jgi:hypothetical protein